MKVLNIAEIGHLVLNLNTQPMVDYVGRLIPELSTLIYQTSLQGWKVIAPADPGVYALFRLYDLP
jgi:hypothetical protein